MSRFLTQTRQWVENRTGLETAVRKFLFESIPASSGWPQVFGSVALFLFLTQALTGILLALNYAATPRDSYTSVSYIVHSIAGGRIVRGLHRLGSSWMIVVVCLHMTQVFIFGAFRKPREATWIAGVFLLLLILTFGLTGYLLPWDNRAYWGTMVTTRIVQGVPFAGATLSRLLGATNGIGVITFSRFYALHVLLLPATTALLIAFHIYLVRRHGVAPAPGDEAHRQTFFPKQLFRDFIAVFVAFLSLFLAAVFLDVPLERMADPTDIAYVPRPEWYFLFLFEILRIFPGRFEVIGTVVLPTIAVATLVALPFMGGIVERILKKRVLATFAALVAFSAWAGLTAAAVKSDPHVNKDKSIPRDSAPWTQLPPEQIAGFAYYRGENCSACHNLALGPPKPGPTLGATGLKHQRDWLVDHFSQAEPQKNPGGRNMGLSEANALVVFVASIRPETSTMLSNIPEAPMRGAQTYVAKACASCHRVNGTGGDMGPQLNGLGDRRTREWLHAHFVAPRQVSPGSIMPPYHFSQKEEDELVRYLFSLPQ